MKTIEIRADGNNYGYCPPADILLTICMGVLLQDLYLLVHSPRVCA